MPELPEVETVVRSLRPQLVGARIEAVWWSGLPLRLARAPDLVALKRLCVGGRVTAVRRKAKYILIDIEIAGRAPKPGGVLIHLGMTGRLQLTKGDVARAKHTHLVWTLAAKKELRFVDPRRFGWIAAGTPLEALTELTVLGPDPLSELDEAALAAALRLSRAPLKAFLLDQRRIAGLGNIYVSEALHRAQLHPRTPAHKAWKQADVLLAAVRAALEEGIANRGTTLRDYVDADGASGNNAQALLVYGRAGEPCRTCGTAIRREVDAGRSTFFCPRCQRTNRR